MLYGLLVFASWNSPFWRESVGFNSFMVGLPILSIDRLLLLERIKFLGSPFSRTRAF